MNNPRVDIEGLTIGLTKQCQRNASGRKVLAIQDTTEPDFTPHRNKINGNDIGPIGNHGGVGFFLHPTYVLDQETGIPLGFGEVKIWNREFGKEPKLFRKLFSIEKKESLRWIESAQRVKENLHDAEEIIFISDRECDIYEFFTRVPDDRCQFIVRANQNRRLFNEDKLLFSFVDSLSVKGRYKFPIPSSKNRSKHRGEMKVKYSKILIKRPQFPLSPDPPFVEMNVIEVKESLRTVRKGEEPVHWILLTTCPVNTKKRARQIIQWYCLRWQIEILFRTIKKGGLDFERSQLTSGIALKKLSLFALDTALKIIQLTKARDGNNSLKASLLFTEEEIHFLYKVIKSLEGKTELQKNSHKKESLAWAAWAIGRLGGWKGYKSESPPGSLTMKRGLEEFETMFLGAQINEQ